MVSIHFSSVIVYLLKYFLILFIIIKIKKYLANIPKISNQQQYLFLFFVDWCKRSSKQLLLPCTHPSMEDDKFCAILLFTIKFNFLGQFCLSLNHVLSHHNFCKIGQALLFVHEIPIKCMTLISLKMSLTKAPSMRQIL